MTKFYLNIGDKEVIGRVSRMNFRKILMLIIDAAKTLKSIHDLGIFHGDLQPENMMFINENLTRIGYINFEHSREKGSTLCKGKVLHKSPEIIFHEVFSAEKNELWSFGTSIGLMIFDHYILSENNYGSIESESETSEENSPKVSEYVNKMRANFNEEAEQKEEKWTSDCGQSSFKFFFDAFLGIFKIEEERISLANFIQDMNSALKLCQPTPKTQISEENRYSFCEIFII
jgi:serine/threonine protein kinase